MTTANIPPQAFTREDVSKAYLWVQSQPEEIKKLATSKETLVAIYLQAKRNGQISVEQLAPVSHKNFKKDLETLATELEQFDDSKKNSNKNYSLNSSLDQEPRPVTPEKSIVFESIEPTRKTIATSSVDSKTQEIVNSVKHHLNMESDSDVIRMLVVLGYEKVKEIFPNN